MHLIIYCHPCQHSHNYKTLKKVEANLIKAEKKYEILDLYEMNFDAYLSEAEYQKILKKERAPEPEIIQLQEKIKQADTLIFIYPVWWYNMPARLKGFFDRVFTSGFAYRFFKVNKYLFFLADIASLIPGFRYFLQTKTTIPLLKGKKAYVFRTYGGPKSGKRIFGNTPAALENGILRFCGITDITIYELFNTDKGFHAKQKENFYEKIDRIKFS